MVIILHEQKDKKDTTNEELGVWKAISLLLLNQHLLTTLDLESHNITLKKLHPFCDIHSMT